MVRYPRGSTDRMEAVESLSTNATMLRFLSLACLTFASMQVQSCVANVYDQRVCICNCSLLLRASR